MKQQNNVLITFIVLSIVIIFIAFLVVISNYEVELNKYRGDNSNNSDPYFISADGQTQIKYPENEQECKDTIRDYRLQKLQALQNSSQTEYNNLNSDIETITNHCLSFTEDDIKKIEDEIEKEMSQY